ncbi:MAG TPA: cell division protein FtsL [Desulfatiglandales bacterium]|nr:cell division protein FtsL [Desulfatiglandales bacterium]
MKRKKGKANNMGIFPFLLVLLFIFLLAGVSYVWVNFQRTQIGYELSELKNEIARIEEYNRKLTLEIAFLKSPELLEDKAVKDFGLRLPLPEQVVFLP